MRSFVVTHDPGTQSFLRGVPTAFRRHVGINDGSLMIGERLARGPTKSAPPDLAVAVAVLGPQAAPTSLQSDGSALTFVELCAKIRQLLAETFRPAQLNRIPSHVSKPFQDAHQFMVPELKRRGSE